MALPYVIAQPYDHMWGGGMPVGMWIVMVIFWLLIVALVILAIVWLVRNLGAGPGHRRGPTALETLERRFAEGSMSVEEYNERRRILEGGGSADR